MRLSAIARLAVFLLFVALLVWALYLVAVGLPYSEVRATVTGANTSQQTIVKFVPYYGGIYSSAALLLIVIGVMKDKWLPLAWVGLLAHLAVGALLIWSFGILYVAATGILAVPVGVLEWQHSNQQRWLLAAWIGAGLTMSIGIILLGTYFGVPILTIGILLALLLLRLQLLPHIKTLIEHT